MHAETESSKEETTDGLPARTSTVDAGCCRGGRRCGSALIQVVTGRRIVAASLGATDLPALGGPRPAPGEVTVVQITRLPIDDDSASLLAATAASADGRRTWEMTYGLT